MEIAGIASALIVVAIIIFVAIRANRPDAEAGSGGGSADGSSGDGSVRPRGVRRA